jgi:hypothetical protein
VDLWCRYDPDPNTTVIEEDLDLLESYLLVPEADFHPELQSPWLLRIELDKMMMLDKRLECAEVASKIAGAYYGMVHVINSEDNAEKLVLRMRLVEGAAPPPCCAGHVLLHWMLCAHCICISRLRRDVLAGNTWHP